MTDPVKEQISACLDGELAEGELDLLLRQLQRDTQLKRSLDGYALIGEALRGQRPVRASAGFADRVAAAVAADAGNDRSMPRVAPAAVMKWMRPAAGMAIAAGVAAIAVVSLRPASFDAPRMASSAGSAEPAPSYTVPTNVDMSGTAFVPAARLTNYVVAHSEYSSPLGRRTVLSGVLSDDDETVSADDVGTQADGVEMNVTVTDDTPSDVSATVPAGSQR